MAGEEPRTWHFSRVPYEWILGAMFVASFLVFCDRRSFVVRGAWLVVVGPIAGRALGVKPGRDTQPARFGLPLVSAAVGWLYCSGWVLVWGAKDALSQDLLDVMMNSLRMVWPVPIVLSFGGVVLAAVRPGKYREFGVFANAAFLLFAALMFDLSLSPVS